MFHFRGLQGAGLLHTLSKHLNLTETKVTANGQVQTRLYQKYGLRIREQVRVSPVEDRSHDEEAAKTSGEPANGLMNLAATMTAADPRSAPVPEAATGSIQELLDAVSARQSGVMDRLIRAVRADLDFDLSETRVTANGRVRTRLAQKYGLHIREQIQLAPGEDQAGSYVANRSEDEVCGPNGGPSNGLTNLAQAIKPADRRSARVREIAPPRALG